MAGYLPWVDFDGDDYDNDDGTAECTRKEALRDFSADNLLWSAMLQAPPFGITHVGGDDDAYSESPCAMLPFHSLSVHSINPNHSL